MKKLLSFCRANIYTIVWSLCYFVAVWAILRWMFNFDILVAHNWVRLAHGEIRGFAGFVFGIFVLGALPIYIATTYVIIRTGKPLIQLDIKKLFRYFNIFRRPQATKQPAPTTQDTPTDTETKPESEQFPESLPGELRGAYVRARDRHGQFQASGFNRVPVATPVAVSEPESNASALPLPPDFDSDDIDAARDDNAFISDDAPMPTFTDINFDDDSAPTPDTTPAEVPVASAVAELLASRGRHSVVDDDTVTSDNMVIIVHNDDAFWVADTDNWFTAGKSKTSPIKRLLDARAKTGKRPVLCLGATNIMDIDALCDQWTQMGITIVHSPDEIPE